MKIVLATSEAVPFAKTGGLADVTSALAKALDRAGHDVWLVTPCHRQAHARNGADRLPIEPTGRKVAAFIGPKRVEADVLTSKLPGTNVTVLLIDQPGYFDRAELYREAGSDYPDNCERFVFFSRAVLETCRVLEIAPDVIHANDWQTGLIPALVDVEYRGKPGFERTASVFTIHNMAFQGRFWRWDMLLTGLGWEYFNYRQMEFYDHLNLLKTGLVFAEMITTVSPTYAREIQTPDNGAGLDSVLRERSADLVGILNGVDVDVWDPETDPALPRNYSVETLQEGKSACKSNLQESLGLPVREDVPLFGMITRMTDQKGLDILSAGMDRVLRHDVQLSFLGTGDRGYEQRLEQLARSHPDKVSAVIGFDEPLAHRIEAGADGYLMPSRYEPCGLNQMYSLRYGTVPVVRSVGGLADSVVDADPHTLEAGTATGFRFQDYATDALCDRIDRAVDLYNDKQAWTRVARTGMQQDWSWSRSAAEYINVYEQAQAKTANSR